jgi:hypothetical protein
MEKPMNRLVLAAMALALTSSFALAGEGAATTKPMKDHTDTMAPENTMSKAKSDGSGKGMMHGKEKMGGKDMMDGKEKMDSKDMMEAPGEKK